MTVFNRGENMRTNKRIADEVITNRDIHYSTEFLIGFRVQHIKYGKGQIVSVSSEWELCTVLMDICYKKMEFLIDELVDPKGEWIIDFARLDKLFRLYKAYIDFAEQKPSTHTGCNPATGAELKIAASKSPAFKPGAPLKAAVNGSK